MPGPMKLAVLGPLEITLIVIVALIVFGFGASKLPAIGKGLGEGIRNFRRALGGSVEKDEESKK